MAFPYGCGLGSTSQQDSHRRMHHGESILDQWTQRPAGLAKAGQAFGLDAVTKTWSIACDQEIQIGPTLDGDRLIRSAMLATWNLRYAKGPRARDAASGMSGPNSNAPRVSMAVAVGAWLAAWLSAWLSAARRDETITKWALHRCRQKR